MDFSESVEYLYGLQRFGIKLGLENMRGLLAKLPELGSLPPCVHVAGTNGKGSVSALLAEILKHSGLRVGLYTSPHLHCFSERIRINGEPVTQTAIVELTAAVRAAADDIPVTFFEATTAMALLAFVRNRVDIAIVETGLGGRLDATNIVEPQLCLITPVSRDHAEHLGETIAEIAAEKAGIIKPGVPVIAGRQLPQAQQVLAATAARQQAELLSADVDFSWGGSHENFQVSGSDYSLDGLTCPLNGTHQLDNFAHAISAAKKLESLGWPVADKAIAQAGQSACWPGRLEWWGDDRSLLFDVCHNRAGVTAMVDYLQAEGIASARFVVGLSGERDAEEVLTPLSSLNAQIYAVPVPEVDSLAPARIADWARSVSLTSKVFDSAEAGFAAARAEGADGPVVVCGSLFLVSALRQRVSRLLNAD